MIGPGAARVIATAQLFPRLNLRRRHSGEVAFDQRFRGDQTISAAIRSLLVEQMPMVVFVHGQDESLLRRRNAKVDLLGAVSMLEASRFEVREWVVPTSEPPTPALGQPVVWIVIPPPVPERRTIEVTDAEQALLEAVEELIAGGEPVWLNLAPSVLPKMGHDDPWQRLAMPLGLKVDTARVVFEQVRDQAGEPINQRIQEIVDFEPEHPIARAADGLRATFDLPVAVEPLEAPARLHHTVLAAIEARPNRWLESDWMLNPATIDEPADTDRFDRPLPIAIAVVRLDPMGAGGQQRLIVVGSGGWLLSYVADLVVSIGGERAVLLNPGNYELLLAGVAWLAGADALIASSPVSRQVARLDGITPAVRTRWRWIAMAGLPAACLLLGVIVWLVRRT